MRVALLIDPAQNPIIQLLLSKNLLKLKQISQELKQKHRICYFVTHPERVFLVTQVTPGRPIVRLVISEPVLMHDPVSFDPSRRLPAVENQGLLHTNFLSSIRG